MFELTAASTLFRRTGFILLLLQLCLFIYGFPPFHMSFWVQVEPVLLAAFVFAYLSCAWLALRRRSHTFVSVCVCVCVCLCMVVVEAATVVVVVAVVVVVVVVARVCVCV